VLVAVGAWHRDVHQRQIKRVRMRGDRAVEFGKVHRHHCLDAGIELRKLGLDALDDQAVVVRDEHFHCGTFMGERLHARAGECSRTCMRSRYSARQAVIKAKTPFQRHSSYDIWLRAARSRKMRCIAPGRRSQPMPS
jgi:hypothetical protein